MTVIEQGYTFYIKIRERQRKKGYIATVVVPPTHTKAKRFDYDDGISSFDVTFVARSKEKIAKKVRKSVEEWATAHHKLDTTLLEMDVTL